jgi:hypothetical protein
MIKTLVVAAVLSSGVASFAVAAASPSSVLCAASA